MKKNFILFVLLLLVTIFTKGQTYHADDKEGLRTFLRQPSAVAGQINAQRLGLQLSDTLNWQTQEFWVSKVQGLVWSENSPKRLLKIGPYFDYKWHRKGLSGELNCSKWQNLIFLDCDSNQIKHINLSQNNALQYLYCDANLLTTLDVTNCLVLEDLICQSNQLKALDVSANTQLRWLMFSFNQISTIDVRNNTKLLVLACAFNQFETLDIENNTALEMLYCNNNRLTTLDVRKNTELNGLECSYNLLETLYLNNTLLYLYCFNNRLTTLNLSHTGVLQVLFCHNNELTSFTTPPYPLPLLFELIGYNNQLLFSEMIKFTHGDFFPQKTINGGEVNYLSNIDFGTEYIFSGYTTQFTWFDITDGIEQTIELAGENGIFHLTKDMIGKRLRCKMTNPVFLPLILIYEVTVTDPENIPENMAIKINVYPNPTTGELRIENGELRINNVEVFDICGKKLKAERRKGEKLMDISHFPAGIYFVKIYTNAGEVVKKIIKH